MQYILLGSTLISSPVLASRIATSLDNAKSILPKELFKMVSADAFADIYWAVLALGVGALFLFFGVKIFKLAVGMVGFGAFGFGTYILFGQAYETMKITPPKTDLVRAVVSFAAGLLGGLVSIWLWKVALISLGVLGGLGASLYIMSWRSNGLVHSTTGRTVFLSIAGVAGAIASLFLESAIIIFSTSLIGAIGVFSGVDIFTKTGFNEALKALMKSGAEFKVDSKTYGMLSGCGATALFGGLVQYLLWRKNKSPSQKSVA